MSTTDLYESIKKTVDQREVLQLGLKKGLKVQNRFVRYAEIYSLTGGQFTDYEVYHHIKKLQQAGKLLWSFRHKKYIVK
jgi:hypothetical protein